MSTRVNHTILLGALMLALVLPGCDQAHDELGPLALRDGDGFATSSDSGAEASTGESDEPEDADAGGGPGAPLPSVPPGPEGWSWNLSRDMLVDSLPGNVLVSQPLNSAWTFLQSPSGLPLGTAMASCWSAGNPFTCWTAVGAGLVGISTITWPNPPCPHGPKTRGLPAMHPGPSNGAVVRWTNPTNKTITIQILGRFSAVDRCGWGNGVDWFVKNQWGGSLSMGTVASNPSVPQDTDPFYVTKIVSAGEYIDFIVDPKGSYFYDSTEFDVLIVGQ